VHRIELEPPHVLAFAVATLRIGQEMGEEGASRLAVPGWVLFVRLSVNLGSLCYFGCGLAAL